MDKLAKIEEKHEAELEAMKGKMQGALKAAEALHQSVDSITHVDHETGAEPCAHQYVGKSQACML